jgi:DNA (cytosine-5)-methyltransferase 1
MIYANENDHSAAHWLSQLPIRINVIDARSIADVKGADLDGFTQCHFFAGIAGWPLALELAGWPDDAPVWTGSCPCQPFSAAGKRKGVDDERHLWPEFRRLIDECRPATIFGEQVASKDGRDWLATVRADLEALGYAVGAADLSAAGVGAPHIRQRLFWVAYADGGKSRQAGTGRVQRSGQHGLQQECCRFGWLGDTQGDGRQQGRAESDGRDASATGGGVGDSNSERLEGGKRDSQRQSERATKAAGNAGGGLANAGHVMLEGARQGRARELETPERTQSIVDAESFRMDGGWAGAEYIPCRDGKARPAKPGVRLLAHGIPGRVAQLRGLGNAIVPQVAAEFVAAFMDAITTEQH